MFHCIQLPTFPPVWRKIWFFKFSINDFTDSFIHCYIVVRIHTTLHKCRSGTEWTRIFSPTRLRDSCLHSTCFLSLQNVTFVLAAVPPLSFPSPCVTGVDGCAVLVERENRRTALTLRKALKNISRLPAEMRTWHLRNTSLECYYYVSILGDIHHFSTLAANIRGPPATCCHTSLAW